MFHDSSSFGGWTVSIIFDVFDDPHIHGNLNPRNAASYVSKTDNYLKLPFLKQIETNMIV